MLKKLVAGKDIFAVLESNASDAIKARVSDAESDAAKAFFAMNSMKIEPVSRKKKDIYCRILQSFEFVSKCK